MKFLMLLGMFVTAVIPRKPTRKSKARSHREFYERHGNMWDELNALADFTEPEPGRRKQRK
ncbi:MAG: hypothetical protein JNJ61_11540 [Anaerolineae bacterium]|nr:hypothetical protein [Anaerolineae bacterium]